MRSQVEEAARAISDLLPVTEVDRSPWSLAAVNDLVISIRSRSRPALARPAYVDALEHSGHHDRTVHVSTGEHPVEVPDIKVGLE